MRWGWRGKDATDRSLVHEWSSMGGALSPTLYPLRKLSGKLVVCNGEHARSVLEKGLGFSVTPHFLRESITEETNEDKLFRDNEDIILVSEVTKTLLLLSCFIYAIFCSCVSKSPRGDGSQTSALGFYSLLGYTEYLRELFNIL